MDKCNLSNLVLHPWFQPLAMEAREMGWKIYFDNRGLCDTKLCFERKGFIMDLYCDPRTQKPSWIDLEVLFLREEMEYHNFSSDKEFFTQMAYWLGCQRFLFFLETV